jgi:hypothetical protein
MDDKVRFRQGGRRRLQSVVGSAMIQTHLQSDGPRAGSWYGKEHPPKPSNPEFGVSIFYTRPGLRIGEMA